jgi:hypothetical protein
MTTPCESYTTLLRVIDDLMRFLTQEGAYVRNHDFQYIEDHLHTKNDLCEVLRRQLETCTTPENLNTLGEEARAHIKHKISTLRQCMVENKKALDMARNFNDRLIRMSLVGDHAIKLKHYNYLGIFTEADVMRVITYTNDI